MTSMAERRCRCADIERCFGGAIPAVLATASADGVVNVTYLSRVHRVDDERVALSNQFMSKTSRNLAANPRASLLLMDPVTHDEFRLALVYERTERRGPVFERLRADVDALAALSNMTDVFRLRAADVFRVVAIEQNPPHPSGSLPTDTPAAPGLPRPSWQVCRSWPAASSRAPDLDILVDTALEGLDRLLGYRHTLLLLVDEGGTRLYTIASRGFDTESIGAEVEIGSGQIGLAAARCEPLRIGGLRQMEKYSRSIRRGYEDGWAPATTCLSRAWRGSRVASSCRRWHAASWSACSSPRAGDPSRSGPSTSRCSASSARCWRVRSNTSVRSNSTIRVDEVDRRRPRRRRSRLRRARRSPDRTACRSGSSPSTAASSSTATT